jgi:hypothetical protein
MRLMTQFGERRYTCRAGGSARVAGLLLALSCSSEPLDGSDAGAGGSGAASPSAPQAGSSTLPGAPGDYHLESYPAGPYGTTVGSVLENFAFLGWRDPVAAGYDPAKLETVRLSDFYDPDGTKGIKLLWINASAVWCSVCKAEMRDIKQTGVNAAFGAKGVQLIGTLFEDNEAAPARPADLRVWGALPDHAIDFPLLLDPGFKLGAFFTSDATPLNLLVDASSMRVLNATMGYSPDYWQKVDRLLGN